MPRRLFVVVCVIVASAGSARAEPLVDVVPPSAPAPRSVPAPAPLPAPVAEPGGGLTAADIRARPLQAREARAAMRLACEARTAACDPIALLGTLERAALVKALEQRRLVVDLAPAGKRVRALHVITMPVFGDDERIFRWANFFHVSSREHVVAREVLLRPGSLYDVDKVDETQRKLRDPLFTTLAVVVPVRADTPGEVDLLVVTRDIFSLRMNSNYEFQGGQFTYLSLSLSENNFLGRRMVLAVVFVMDQATLSLGPLYINKNLLGKQLEVRGRGGPIINRDSFEAEGSASAFAVSRPLWSLASRWGWTVDASHRYATERSFRDTELRTFDAPSTPEVEAIPHLYRQRYWSVGVGVVRQLGGEALKHRIKAGYDLTSQRPTVPGDFAGSDAARADFVADVLPRDERTGVVYGAYEVFTPRYREYRDVDSFDLAEDTRLGPRVQLTVGTGLRALASDSNFARVSLDGGWTEAWGGDGQATLAASLSARLDGSALVDRVAAVTARAITPATRYGRGISELRITGVYRDSSNRFLYLGGDSGLRAYPVNFIDGDRRAVIQSEWRTRSARLFLGSRWGLIGFHDAGGAADRAGDVRVYQDVGFGLRALGPQLSPEVFRFDIGFPLSRYDVPGGTRGVWPPRITAGYRQAF